VLVGVPGGNFLTGDVPDGQAGSQIAAPWAQQVPGVQR
jgi:hypothetical protein